MSKPLTNDQIEAIKQEMYDCDCDLEVIIYIFTTNLMHEKYESLDKDYKDYRLITFYQGIVDHLTYPKKGV